jgi:DNA primase
MMSGHIPREFIESLLTRVDIVDLIDSHVPLKKSGSNYMARCPFHNEKSPSFSVSRAKQMYHCFGCGVGGNAIGFLMDYLHLNYVEAIEELADFTGINVPTELSHSPAVNRPAQNDLKAIYQLLEQVALFYRQQLRSTTAIAIPYLKSRGISGQTAKDFGLGYAPDQWNELGHHFPRQLLAAAGLLVSSDNGQQYDRFRHRLMFPIKDKRGRIIGFGGRVLDDSKPKYLNSPETLVFSKGHHLYGLYELLSKTPKPERIVVVEGYMDVIALAQFGLHYAVATLGTATSKTHLDVLFRFCHELVFCFDGDEAGRKAAWRAVETVLPSLKDGRQVRIMLLPQGHDPDSLVRAEGVEGFAQQLLAAQALSDYFFAQMTASVDLSSAESQARLVQQAKPYLEQLPNGLLKDSLKSRLEQLTHDVAQLVFSENRATLSSQFALKYRQSLSLVETAIALLLQNPHLADHIAEKIALWDTFDLPNLGLLKHLVQFIIEQNPVNTSLLLELYRGHADELQIKTLATWPFLYPDSGIEAEFLDAVKKINDQAHEANITALMTKDTQYGLTHEEQQYLRQLLKDSAISPL